MVLVSVSTATGSTTLTVQNFGLTAIAYLCGTKIEGAGRGKRRTAEAQDTLKGGRLGPESRMGGADCLLRRACSKRHPETTQTMV